jgi:hypothetical protein
MLNNRTRLKVLAVFQAQGVTIHDYLFNYLWKNHGIRLDCVPIEEVERDAVGGYDVVLNAICNDAFQEQRLQRLEAWCRESAIPLLNSLEALRNCRRLRAYKLWSANDIQCARVVKAPSLQALKKQNLNYPVILRNEITHLGSTMQLLGSVEEAERLPAKDFHSHTVAIEYHDYRSPDGYYRKYRCALVGDRVVPRHIISSRDWNIHSGSRDEMRAEDHRAEELPFLFQPPPESDELQRAKSLLGLDYAIADYALGPDGRPFIFEMNPCSNIINPESFKREWSYQLDAVHRYCEAFADLLLGAGTRSPTDYIILPVIL